MANYYSSGGAWFPTTSEEHKQIVIKVLKTLDWARDQDFYDNVINNGELSEVDRELIRDRVGGDKKIADCVVFTLQVEDYYHELEYAEEDNALFIYSIENINADGMANLVQGLLAMLEYDNTVAISWADTHSKSIPWEYGGGAVVVSRLGSVWIETNFWTNMIAKKLFEQAGLEQNMLYPRANCPICYDENPMIEDSHTKGGFHYSTVTCDECESEWVNIYAPISRQMLRTGKE